MADNELRILITRLSHIGDAVLTLPLLCQLRRAFPSARIAWAMEKAAAKLLRLHPAIDELFIVPKGWLKSPGAWILLRRTLLGFRPDVTLDSQGLLKSSMLAWLSGAPIRIGFAGRFGREGSTWLNNRRIEPRTTHLIDRNLELLQFLGVQPTTIEFGLPVCPQSLANCRQWLDQYSISNFTLINPGASWPSKLWLPERYGRLARLIEERTGMRSVVIWNGDAELAMANEIIQSAGESAILARPTTLAELAALATLATIFVGGDTGPLHVAQAMGCHCVGLHGPTRPEDSGAYGPQHRSVLKWHQSGSSKRRRRAQNVAMRDITVDDVMRAVTDCLANRRRDYSERVA